MTLSTYLCFLGPTWKNQDYYCPWLSIVQSGTIIILKKPAPTQGEKHRKCNKNTQKHENMCPHEEEFLSHLRNNSPGKKKIRKRKGKIHKKSNRRHQKKTGRHRKKRRQENRERAKSATLVKFVEITSIFDEIGQYKISHAAEWGWPESPEWSLQKRRLTWHKIKKWRIGWGDWGRGTTLRGMGWGWGPPTRPQNWIFQFRVFDLDL